jgi:hypothetical protein
MQCRPSLRFVNTPGNKNGNNDKQANRYFFPSEAIFKPALIRGRVNLIIGISLSVLCSVHNDRWLAGAL